MSQRASSYSNVAFGATICVVVSEMVGIAPKLRFYLCRFSLVLAGIVLVTMTARSQWESAEILLNRLGGKHPTAMAANGDTLHVAWEDYPFSNWEIRYMRSLDGGNTWEEEVELTNDAASSENARIAVSGESVHLIFSDEATGTTQVSYFRSTDAGASWSQRIPISASEAYAGYGRIATYGDNVHVVWMDGRNGQNYDIYHRHSTDGGFTWSEEQNLTSAETADTMLLPTVQVSEGRVHVLYTNWLGNSVQNWYINSLDEGTTWSTPVLVDEDLFDARQSIYMYYYPAALGVSGDQVYMLATRGWESQWALYLNKSLDGGLTWGEMLQVTGHETFTSDPWLPLLAVSDSIVHIAWFDSRSGGPDPDLYYDRSVDQGVTWSGETKLNDSRNLSTSKAAIAISGAAVHTIWGSRPTGALDMALYYRRNPTGNLVGVSSVGSGQLSQFIDSHSDRSVRVEQVSIDAFSIQWSQREANADNVSPAGVDLVDIYDINGHRVESISVEPGSNAVMWSVGKVPRGLYLAQLMCDDVSSGRAFVIHR